MSVIPLTIFFSLLLAGLFMALFLHEQRRRRFGSPERDSLLPLADEVPPRPGAANPPARMRSSAPASDDAASVAAGAASPVREGCRAVLTAPDFLR